MTPTSDKNSAARCAWNRATDRANVRWVFSVCVALVFLVIVLLSNNRSIQQFFISQTSTEMYRCESSAGGTYAMCRYVGPADICTDWLPVVDCEYMFKAGYKICRLPSPSESEEIAKYMAILTDSSRFCARE